MSPDLIGTVILGATAADFSKPLVRDAYGNLVTQDALRAAARQEGVAGARTILIGAALGAVFGLIGGAVLWKSHPVAGAALGGIFVGPLVGGAAGVAIASSQLKQAQAAAAQKVI